MTNNNNNKWARTCAALHDLLDLLRCSKCKKSLHDPQQYLTCGHFACISCINNSNNTCIDCLLNSRNEDVLKDDTVQKIVQACCTIAKEINCSRNNEDGNFQNNVKSEEVPSGDINVPIEDSKVSDNKAVIARSTSKLSRKSRKRKKGCPRNVDTKKPRLDNRLDKFRSLLSNPKKINKTNPLGETTLLQACKKNHVDVVKRFLDAGADPNIPCAAGWTPLQESVDFGYFEIVEMLLKANADVNKKGHEGRTALHEAAKNNNLPLMRLLLEHGAKLDILDCNGKAPMNYCLSDEARDLLYVDMGPEVQNSTSIDDLEQNDSGEVDGSPSTSSRKTRSFVSKNEETNIEVITNIESSIKKEENTPEDLAIVYEKINNSNSSLAFPESPGKENCVTKANNDSTCAIPKMSQKSKIENNVLGCSNSQPSINLLNTNIVNQRDTLNSSQTDSEEFFIDVEN